MSRLTQYRSVWKFGDERDDDRGWVEQRVVGEDTTPNHNTISQIYSNRELHHCFMQRNEKQHAVCPPTGAVLNRIFI